MSAVGCAGEDGVPEGGRTHDLEGQGRGCGEGRGGRKESTCKVLGARGKFFEYLLSVRHCSQCSHLIISVDPTHDATGLAGSFCTFH